MSVLNETAYAKLNLALHVRGRRADGYHDIETIFAFCEDGDGLTIEEPEHPIFELEVSGQFARDICGPNLIVSAWQCLGQEDEFRHAVKFGLDKRLPVASGIGGGSADAAAALRLMTRFWNLDLSLVQRIARNLGADVPACLFSQLCHGEGAGDQITPMELPEISGTPVLLVHPNLPLPTSDVFARWDGIDRGPLGDWRDGRNDLEPAATALVPEIAKVLDWLRGQSGADFVRMSGSGATCFALFDDETARDQAAAAVPQHWWHLATRLR